MTSKKPRVGRPTTYSKNILIKTREYISICHDSHEVAYRPRIESGLVNGEEAYRVQKTKIPTLEGLAFHLRVHKDTIQEWKKVHKPFSVLIDELLAKQADELINKGLSGDYNPVIAKVLLTKHGYREGLDQTTNDKDLPKPILNVPRDNGVSENKQTE